MIYFGALGVLSVVAPVHDNVNFNDLLSSYNEGRYFIRFNFATVPAWAGITAGYNEVVVTRQGETNWFFEIKESEQTQYRLRIIYSRQSSIIKIAYKIPATKLGGITTSLTNQNDLNDVVSSGVYSWSGSGTAPLNNFKPQGSLLLVWKTGTQIFQVQWPNTFNQSSVGIGFRLRWNNEWSAWYKILLSLDQ